MQAEVEDAFTLVLKWWKFIVYGPLRKLKEGKVPPFKVRKLAEK